MPPAEVASRCIPLPQLIPAPLIRTSPMSSYNLTHAADRARYRVDHLDELEAIEQGRWPRDVDDALRWTRMDPEHAARMCRAAVDYIDGLERRIAAGEAGLDGFESG